VTAFGSDNWSSHHALQLLEVFRKALNDSAPAHIEAAITAVESELQSVAARSAETPPNERLARRFEIMKSCATHRLASAKLRAFDTFEEAQRMQEFARSYEPPAPLYRRGLRALGM
jgi:hypothetical protein